jgi:hypothetical protein
MTWSAACRLPLKVAGTPTPSASDFQAQAVFLDGWDKPGHDGAGGHPFPTSLAKVSRRPMVRLNTRRSGAESLSRTK